MHQKQSILSAYNKTAQAYASQFSDELAGKPLDRLLLNRFAAEQKDKGKIMDMACGPGHTTHFLYEAGLKNLVGIDLSPEMINVARSTYSSSINFRVGNMLELSFDDHYFSSGICFYGIVHFNLEELTQALKEIHRVIKPGGRFFFSFHVGQGTVSVQEFLEQKVEMNFYYFEVEKVLEILDKTGWKQIEVVERYPYEEVEYPSRRAYVLVERMRNEELGNEELGNEE